jgi:hypothetical protein
MVGKAKPEMVAVESLNCPVARNAVTQRVSRSQNCLLGRSAVSSQYLCQGENCMAWRWVDGSKTTAEDHGFCGLAGYWDE